MPSPTIYFPNGTVTRKKPNPEKQEYKFIKGLIFFGVVLICFGGIILVRRSGRDNPPTTNAGTIPATETRNAPTPTPKVKDTIELIGTINEIIDQHEGMYSVRFEDFNSTAAFGINDEVVVDAASVNKIPILAALYHLADTGGINLDEEITIAPKDVQNYGTGTIYTRQPPHVYSHRELAKLLMKVSDNTAAFVLSNRVIGRNNVQKFVNDLGLTNTDITENTTTNKDQAILMRAIFEGNVASEELTKEMLSFMEDSIFEERLPRNLPEEVHVYHKIGNQIRVIHDAGVIEFDDKRYYLGVLTTDIPDEEEAKATIGEISEVVYHCMRE